jgi:Zn finger protein HypA/HybF involved in hydrogenase expression
VSTETNIESIARTLDQELAALVRGVSMECVVCGEFVLRLQGVQACPECNSILAQGREIPKVALPSVMQAG